MNANERILAHLYCASSLQTIPWSTWDTLIGTTQALLSKLEGAVNPNASAKQNRSYLVASSSPLQIALLCTAAWRKKERLILPPNIQEETLRRIAAEESQGTVILVQPDDLAPLLRELFLETSPSSCEVRSAPSISNVLEQTLAEIPQDQILLTCYTSGSTGRPEPHEKSARQLLGEAKMLADLFLQDIEELICEVPANHLYGLLFGVLAPLLAGVPIRGTCDNSKPSIQPTKKGAALVSVPAHLQAYGHLQPELLGKFQKVFSSAAPLPSALATEIINNNPQLQVIEVLGSTETGGIAYRSNAPLGSWQPFPPCSVSANAEGELIIRSPFTAQAMQPYQTADKVTLTGQGFQHHGRSDGVVKVGGKRVSIQEIEAWCRSSPLVADVACIVLEVTNSRQKELALLVAPVAKPSSAQALKEELAAHLRKRFDKVVVPKKYRFLQNLPRNPAGKLTVEEALRALHSQPSSYESTNSERRDELAQALGDFQKVEIQSLTENEVSYTTSTHESQKWFQGHFDEFPVLPGVVQLKILILQAAKVIWPSLQGLQAQIRVKFKDTILPRDHLRVELHLQRGRGHLSFQILKLSNDPSPRKMATEATLASTGTLEVRLKGREAPDTTGERPRA
ncbi:MAG: AMP-binding protein [Polyangiaceae bacterium]|nr:AMP-binding protein [Polyangiaceae bacterium]